MALETQRVNIPLLTGIDESIDERVRMAAGEGMKLAALENAEYTKTGAVNKRNGFDKLVKTVGTNDDAISQARGLFSTGEELCLLSERRLYGWASDRSKWYDRGQVAPAVGTQKILYRGKRAYGTADVAVNAAGSYIVHAADFYTVTSSGSAESDTRRGIEVVVKTIDGQLVRHWELASTLDATKPHSARCAYMNDKLVLAYANGIVNPSDLKLAYWDPASTGQTFIVVLTPTTDLYHTIIGRRSFDVIAHSVSDRVIVAWIDNTNKNINLRVYSTSSFTQVGTATISTNAPYSRVSLCIGPSDNFFVLAQAGDTIESTTRQIESWRRNATTGSVWGPLNLYTLSNSDSEADPEWGDNLGCAYDTTLDRVACSWQLSDQTGNLPTKGLLHYRHVNGGGTTFSTGTKVYNLAAASRPWWENGRAYVAASLYQPSGLRDSYPYAVNLVFDIHGNHAGALQPLMSALYNVGIARIGIQGSANNVATPETGKRWWMSTEFDQLILKANGEIYTQEPPKPMSSRVELDYDKAPLVAVTKRGEAVIGGSFVSWYAGFSTEELGWVAPPLIRGPITEDDTSGSPGLNAVETSWLGVWEWTDERGVLHRSAPGRAKTITVVNAANGGGDAGNNHVDMAFWSLNASLRHLQVLQASGVGEKPATIALFRGDANSDGVFYRASGFAHLISNRNTFWASTNAKDDGNNQETVGGGELTDALYTTGGILEAISPEGARIPLVAGERLWLAGFFRRSRLQHSHIMTPGTATDIEVAPEYNEALAIGVTDGEDITGLAELDEARIVFTTKAIYVNRGFGPNNAGNQNDFSQLTRLQSDTGCEEPRSVVAFNEGVAFKAPAGLYLLDRAHRITFFGAPVRDTVDAYPVITSAVVVPLKNQVRFTCTNSAGDDGRVVVYDYRVEAWSVWRVKDGSGNTVAPVAACMHKGDYHLVDSAGQVYQQNASTWIDGGADWVPMAVETSFLQVGGHGGWQRVRRVIPLCVKKTAHGLTVSCKYDYATSAEFSRPFTEAEIDAMPAPTVREQPVARVSRQRCTAISMRVEDTAPASLGTGEGFVCSGFAVEVGVKRGVVKAPLQQRS